MDFREDETGRHAPPHKRERPPTRTEWMMIGLGLGAASLLFAATIPGRALFHIQGDHAALLRSLSAGWIGAGLCLLALWHRERRGADTRDVLRFVPFTLIAIAVATILAIGTILFG